MASHPARSFAEDLEVPNNYDGPRAVSSLWDPYNPPPPLPSQPPLPQAPPSNKPLLKPSEKGIEIAKKMLRAFSFQRKQTMSTSVANPVDNNTPGPSNPAVVETKPEKVKVKKKTEKPKSSTHPLFLPLQESPMIIAENEEMRRKHEIAELGIPLSLIQPGHQAMANKAWPSKAMPPTNLLTPDQVQELIEKARKAKQQGKVLKFNYKEYFPTYDNPFQQSRKKTNSPPPSKDYSPDRIGFRRSRSRNRGKKGSRWDLDRDIRSSSSNKNRSERDESSKDRETEVDLNDYVVCDSWSLDTEDKGDDSSPISESKSVKNFEESVVSLPEEVTNLVDIPMPKEDLKPVETIIPEPVIQPADKKSLETLKKEEYNENKHIMDVIARNAAKGKLRPVVDEFIYDLDDNSSDNSVTEITPHTKTLARLDPKVTIKQEIIDVNSETSNEKVTKDARIEEIPLPVITAKGADRKSCSKDRKENKSDRERKSPPQRFSRSKESRDRHDKQEKTTSYSVISTKTNHLVTPERFKADDDKIKDNEIPTDIQVANIELPIIPDKPIDMECTLISDCEPLSVDHSEDYQSPDISSPKLEPEIQQQMCKEMEDCLDTWNFVLKICQPLLFRHDRNKCYRETKALPTLWYTENPKVCDCVKDRAIVYEELDTLKMDLVEKLHDCDQIPEESPPTCRDWYLKEKDPPPGERNELDQEYEKFMGLVLHDQKRTTPKETKSKKDVENKSEITNPQAIEKSKLQVIENKTPQVIEKEKPQVIEKSKTQVNEKPKLQVVEKQKPQDIEKPKPQVIEKTKPQVVEKLESKTETMTTELKVKEVTSEVGTSMDESIMSIDDTESRVKKKNKKGKGKKKKTKASSEYWSEESIVLDTTKTDDKKTEKKETQKKKKKERPKRPKSSSSESNNSNGDSSDEKSEKKSKDSKDKKKKISKAKEKLLRKRRLEKKRRLKKLKEKRLKKIKKWKEKVQKSLEDDEDVGEFIKKEKQKKKEIKTKEKKKSLRQKKLKKEVTKKKKKVSSSSSSSSTSSNSSSDSEKERKQKKKKKKQKETVAKAEKAKKKSKSKKKKRSTSDSYSENEEEFDMNILNNIKMEQVSDDESTKAQMEDFSPRRPCTRTKEIISASEFHSDFVGRAIKQERMDYEEQVIQEVQNDTKEKEALVIEEHQIEEAKNKRVDELKRSEALPPRERRKSEDKISKSGENSISHDSSSFGESKDPIQSADSSKPKPTPEESVASPASQDSTSSFQSKPYEKDDSFLRPSENSNFSFGDVMSSENYSERQKDNEDIIHEQHESSEVRSEETKYKAEVDMFQASYEFDNDSKEHFSYYNSAEYAEHHNLQYPIQKQPTPSPTPAEYEYGPEMEAHPIETVVSATGQRGEIKCDWRPTAETVKTGHTKLSRWGKKPTDANFVLTTTAEDVFPIRSVLDQASTSEANQLYKIETISTVRESKQEEADYDGAYADTYGESDRLQYGDCFASEREEKRQGSRLSLDDRIGLVLQQSILGLVAKKETSPEPEANETGILINRLSPSGRARRRKEMRADRPNKRVKFADGYNPGQDSDIEEPPVKKRKVSSRYGCAWPCPANHPDHVPLWDALPPPPPPPGSPPPPPAPIASPAVVGLLRTRKRRSDKLRPPHQPFVKNELQDVTIPDEPPAKITRLPKVLSHPRP